MAARFYRTRPGRRGGAPVRAVPLANVAVSAERTLPVLRLLTAALSTPAPVDEGAAGSTPLASVGGMVDTRVTLQPAAVAAPPERGSVCSPGHAVARGFHPAIRAVSSTPESPAIALVSTPSGNKGSGAGFGSAMTLRPITTTVSRSLDPALTETMRTFAERLATMAALHSDKEAKADPGTADDGVATQPPDATEPASARAADVAAFADTMRRRPSGLCLWDDNSVHPVVAIASSWGLSKADLASNIARRELMPLYVEQELRFERLETELKFVGANEEELADPHRKLADRLSHEAAGTVEIYRRSELLREALQRVDRELRQGRIAMSRTSQMSERGIDWRAIDQATNQRRRALAVTAQQIGAQHNGIG